MGRWMSAGLPAFTLQSPIQRHMSAEHEAVLARFHNRLVCDGARMVFEFAVPSNIAPPVTTRQEVPSAAMCLPRSKWSFDPQEGMVCALAYQQTAQRLTQDIKTSTDIGRSLKTGSPKTTGRE